MCLFMKVVVVIWRVFTSISIKAIMSLANHRYNLRRIVVNVIAEKIANIRRLLYYMLMKVCLNL